MTLSAFCWCPCHSCWSGSPRHGGRVSEQTRRRHAAAALSFRHDDSWSPPFDSDSPPGGTTSGYLNQAVSELNSTERSARSVGKAPISAQSNRAADALAAPFN